MRKTPTARRPTELFFLLPSLLLRSLLVDASSKAKPTSVSAGWATVLLKVLDELEKYNNPRASIPISLHYLLSFQLNKT